MVLGESLGSYRILGKLGEGGMGEVYRARDTKLAREVAVKVLPDAVANDPERIARFEREARSLAALHHPNVATLFGMEQSEGRHFLVMELVEGLTLAERLLTGPMAVAEALAVARQIADGLEAAHERGIVHRDLKPANVKITPDDVVKVLDFGLAKPGAGAPVASGAVRSPGGGDGLEDHSPTITTPAMTEAGIILGTAAYMSPEQAKGMAADHRSDIFSFGCVLYELLAGRQPFRGESVSDVLASVIAREPDWAALPSPINPRLTALLQRCLAKSRRQRWQAIGDVRAEIELMAADPAGSATMPATAATGRPTWRARATPLAAGALAGALVVAAAWVLADRSAPPPQPVTKLSFTVGPMPVNTGVSSSLAIAPDGSQILWRTPTGLSMRRLSSFETSPVAAASGPQLLNPTFSPDGRAIAFADVRVLKVLQLDGTTSTLAEMDDDVTGLSWSGSQLLAALGPKGIVRVPTTGGPIEPLVTLQEGEYATSPQLLPGGTHVLFTLGSDALSRVTQVLVQALGSGARTVVAKNGGDARYVATGHVVFVVDGVLMALPFDLATMSGVGAPVSVVEGVLRSTAAGLTVPFAVAAISASGTLAYVAGPKALSNERVVLLIDRIGQEQRLTLPPGAYEAPRISPDGRRLAVSTDDGREAIVWVYELSGTAPPRRLTFDGRNRVPIWSPDGQRLAYQSTRGGDSAIWVQRADGADDAERLTTAEANAEHIPESWSPDARFIAYTARKGEEFTLRMLRTQDRTTTAFGAARAVAPLNAAISPDGRWVAYTLRESGSASVFVEPFPPTGARYQTSVGDSAHHPFWSPDGTELFYFALGGGVLVSTPVSLTSSVAFGAPARVPGVHPPNTTRASPRNYDITPDGRRFVAAHAPDRQVQLGGADLIEVRVVLNWFEELNARVPVR
ncbi:MAG: protein kinase domain-containing protein [Acidobacteriota bacterium]